MEMEIRTANGLARVYTPYNPKFVKRIKGIGGAKWDAYEKCWCVPETAVDVAREIMSDVYGYSDIQKNETISIKVTFNEAVSEYRGDVILFGKILSHACGRDSGARVGDDVAYINGGPESGGSTKNWCSTVKEGSVAILSNVNKHVYEKEEMNYDVTVEVLEEKKEDRRKLLEEKERLLKRISEINKILEES